MQRGLRGVVAAALAVALACALATSAAAFTSRHLGKTQAVAPKPQPLTGEGENLQLVANLPIDPGTQGNAASDLELHGNYAFVGSYGEGVVIVDISDPTKPTRVGRFDCPGGQNDIQLSPDGRYLALAIETTANKCHPGDEGTAILDVSDPAKPMEIAWIGQNELEDGSHNNTLDWPYLYVDQYINTYSELEIFDLSDPAKPKKVGGIDYGGQDSHHDLIVDHRPDGKDFAYAASINFTDVIDVTDPTKPVLRERIRDPQLTISHQAEPNFDRTLLLATDEYGGGTGVGACGGNGGRVPVGDVGIPPQFSDPASLGALHIYRLAPDGTIAGENGLDKAGVFNIPYQPNDDPNAGCTIHVFWQAPDQNRLVTAWYGRGTRVVDFSDPAKPKELAWYVPTGGDTWSAKPHNGYIFSGDIVRGLDVFKYTGEGGAKWPATAGPAEVQRARVQGATPPNPTGQQPPGTGQPPQQGKRTKSGRKAFTKHVRVPNGRGKRTTLVLSLYDSKKRLQSRVRVRARDGRVVRVRGQAAGLSGFYRYTIRHGDRGRILGTGLIRVRRDNQTRVNLPPGQRLVCTAQAT